MHIRSLLVLVLAAQTLTPQVLASVDARWDRVYCDLTDLSRVGAGELMVRYRFRSARAESFRLPHRNIVPDTRVFDPSGGKLFGVMKDAGGQPLSSTNLDGQAGRALAAGASQAHWARLQAPADNVKTVTVLVEGCMPFEAAPIQGTPAVLPLTTIAKPIASQDGEADGLVVEMLGLRRGPGGLVLATFRYRNNGASQFRFPAVRQVSNAYLLDSANRRKLPVARDANKQPLSSDTTELASPSGEIIPPGSAMTFWAMFPAPDEKTKTVTVTLPQAPPFDAVPLSGSGTGSADAGTAVAGASVGVEAALKTLGATVTEAEIRIAVAADVMFDFDKSDIRKEAEASLRNVATVLHAHPGAAVAIEGHTDARGADAYNQKLSEARAASVKQWLITNAQVNGAAITTRGLGRTKPVAPNAKPDGSDDPDGRAKNRRVEIVVTRQGGR